ncbi:MAG: HAD family hydrolase [Magnetococcus sp. DMHC-6]
MSNDFFVFFDIGFTLLGGPNMGPVRRLLESLDIPLVQKKKLTDTLFCHPWQNADELAFFLRNNFAIHLAQVEATVRSLWESQKEEAYVLPGVRQLLDGLTSAGVAFGFLSNIWTPFYEGFTRHFPQEAQNRPCFPSYRYRMAKPDPEFYRYALQQVGIPPARAVMIGDTYQMDILPAQRLGMKTIWILHRPHKELEDILGILNGELPPADLTLDAIGSLRLHHIQKWFNPS